MKYYFIIILALPILTFSSAQSDLVKVHTDLVINGRFEEAWTVLNTTGSIQNQLLNSFYKANWYHARFSDLGYSTEEKAYTELLDEVIRHSGQRLENAGLSPADRSRLYFYRGSALGLLAFYHGEQKNWWEALKYGRASMTDLENALQLDSTQVEARLGIGVYLYWRSRKTTWIPFLEDRSAQAITMISAVAAVNSPSQAMAAHQLVYVLLDAGRFTEAEKLAGKWCAVYPESAFMRWALAHTYYKMQRNKEAATEYREIIRLLSARVDPPVVQIFDARFKLFEVLIRLRDKTACRREKEMLDQLSGKEIIRRYRADKLQKIIDLQAGCNDF